MSKAIRNGLAHHPPVITVGDLIDELCRLPDTACVSFRCPALDHELTFHRLRKRSREIVEIEVDACSEGPAVVPSADGAFHAGRQRPQLHSRRETALLHKERG